MAVEWSQVGKGIQDDWNEGKRIETIFNPVHYLIYSSSTPDWAWEIANAIHSPKAEWQRFDKYAPYDAGNVDAQTIKSDKVDDMHKILGHYALYENPPGSSENGTLFLTSFCESAYLRDEMTTYNDNGCALNNNSGKQ
jgi:hypothetical protein